MMGGKMSKNQVIIIVFIAGIILGYSINHCMNNNFIDKYKCIWDETHGHEIVFIQSY